ncbi:hypothetical protein SLNWT_2608 [Streptomyces albus]|uniref:Uncharacterized protein n=1 Tax=Streptomyces albus (strain ATCC 21838 / DSM 41398 / FERM P-419 / JCM 4703 / NBRC 107858) TaxID=1081613 RepID=A0A0B5EN15_STRA4|nr:hypothetical protein SLNWT_2608 [Streptomyces albus]AOU77295.1 hypothetical protein SLNHY_2604 [Streptomyces albus]AYN33070.1 hypothetical protein DUI70_2569 [Streptomyces albus]
MRGEDGGPGIHARRIPAPWPGHRFLLTCRKAGSSRPAHKRDPWHR